MYSGCTDGTRLAAEAVPAVAGHYETVVIHITGAIGGDTCLEGAALNPDRVPWHPSSSSSCHFSFFIFHFKLSSFDILYIISD